MRRFLGWAWDALWYVVMGTIIAVVLISTFWK